MQWSSLLICIKNKSVQKHCEINQNWYIDSQINSELLVVCSLYKFSRSSVEITEIFTNLLDLFFEFFFVSSQFLLEKLFEPIKLISVSFSYSLCFVLRYLIPKKQQYIE